jgi:hypothetical protein
MNRHAAWACAAILLFGTSASALTIDDFTASQVAQIVVGGSSPQSSGAMSVTLGDGTTASRTLTVARTGMAPGMGSVSLDSNISDPGQLSFATGASVNGMGTVEYTGFGSDLDISGDATLRLVAGSDLGASVDVTLSDSMGGSAVASFSVPASSPMPLDIPLSSLAGVDLSSINGISIAVSGPSSVDVEIGSIGTTVVPEPGSLMLLGLGSLGLAFVGRRRGRA